PPYVPSASRRVDAGAFRAGIHHAFDARFILAAFGGFRCASSTLRQAVASNNGTLISTLTYATPPL
ncbi:MAG: hypothetical protein AAB115_06190, partial [Pseudomonadota bacterium]